MLVLVLVLTVVLRAAAAVVDIGGVGVRAGTRSGVGAVGAVGGGVVGGSG